ncbi:MoxR family ATPase [Leptospira noguchii]|uniref:MoxR family ATPase n=1 Tax=Leptospira noguchii TaxID=28182 RepID=A0A9Q8RS72_9LEPT|nr:MoxR family ATPase [Leptospira noguchii]EMI63950.1 ATPase, AAA family [Leptospira noguchii str. Bonito]EMS82459.1 ATPase, AAA family [Leptospira noguchii str. Cascata]TQE83006.1 MoxR family ATPase [Leptospira noguchii]UOG35962.1 MoxR family ATPase [Leptospira noguchii]UOG39808.1 MoxR family ATPase [Leptospira noguchii]
MEKETLEDARTKLETLKQELGKEITGQDEVIRNVLVCLICQGHVLLEGMPGLAKTLLARSLASALDLNFKRIQFTPDLLPADLVGTVVFNPKTTEFETRKGPVFTGVLLADEINRAPAKVQSALLESMEEKTVTIGDKTYQLDKPFLVIATQNPIDQDGTYPLPEAQMDRFLMKINVDYPTLEEEVSILDQHGKLSSVNGKIKKTVSSTEILRLSSMLDEVFIEEKIKSYIVRLVRNTRPEERTIPELIPYIRHGASPRASLSILKSSKANALLSGRTYVTPEDVKTSLVEILRHRILLTFEAISEELNVESLIRTVVEATPVP